MQYQRPYVYYRLLGISRKAPPEEIKKAYRELAKVLHPDANPDPKAKEAFIKVTRAYEILSNTQKKVEYDSSLMECANCGSTEVVEVSEDYWRCDSCYCKFDSIEILEVIPRDKREQVKEDLRALVSIFKTTQCYSCSKFYTSPDICPFKRLESNCTYFSEMPKEETTKILEEGKWSWKIMGALQQVKRKGRMAKCHIEGCGKLNPNPQKQACWKCKRAVSLLCPYCLKAGTRMLLNYDIETQKERCPLNGCPFNILGHPQPKKIEGPKPKLKLIGAIGAALKKGLSPERETTEVIEKLGIALSSAGSPLSTPMMCPSCGQETLEYETRHRIFFCQNTKCLGPNKFCLRPLKEGEFLKIVDETNKENT